MRKLLVAFLILTVLVTAGFAAGNERSLQGALQHWTGVAGDNMPIEVTAASDRTLVVKAQPDGGSESFPHLNLALKQPEDWRRFHKLVGEVKLTSGNPDIVANGKEINFCLYDENLRHENLAGNPAVQQSFGKPKVAAGDWQPLELDLSTAERGKVRGLDIYLYEMPYSYPHEYQFEFRNLRLVGEDLSKVVFDGVSFDPAILKGEAGRAVGELATAGDGLRLALGDRGGIVRLTEPAGTLGRRENGVSGILLRDAAQNGVPVMAGGEITAQDGVIRQAAVLPELKLSLEAEYLTRGESLIIRGAVETLEAADRAVTVYVTLPVDSGSYEFFQSLSRSAEPFREFRSLPHYEVKLTGYPFTALADSGADLALGIGVDLGKPCTYRLGFNPALKVLYVAFDLALTDIETVHGESLKVGNFEAVVYPTDAAWGMRSAAERYYQLYPEYFVDRVQCGGGWEVPWHRRQSGQTPEEIVAGGYRFVWGADELSAEEWNWNADHDILNLIYIEPEFFQFSMGDYQSPTTEETMARLKRLSENDETEWRKFLPLHYSTAYNCNPHAKSADRRAFLHSLMKATLASGMQDKNGELVLGLGNRVAWIGDSGFGAMVPCNLNPAIPDGRGMAAFETMLEPMMAEFAAEQRRAPRGFGLDCFMDVPPDYRRENFRYAALPLAFDPETKQPMVQRGFGSLEWLKALTERCRPRNMVVMANAFGPMTFASPYLDIFGIEGTMVSDPEFLRTIAGPKRPITYLPYDPQPKPGIEYHLFWGIYPGRNVTVDILRPMIPVLDALYEASWQPVTRLEADQGVRVERYGVSGVGKIYFTAHNPGRSAVKTTLRPALSELGLVDGDRFRQIYPEERELSGTRRVNLTLKAGETVVLAVEPSGRPAAAAAETSNNSKEEPMLKVVRDKDSLTLYHGADRVEVGLDRARLTFTTSAGCRVLQAYTSNYLDWGVYWPQPAASQKEPEIVETGDRIEVKLCYPVELQREFQLKLTVDRQLPGIQVEADLINRSAALRCELWNWGWEEEATEYATRDEIDGIWRGKASSNAAYLPAVEGDFDVYGWAAWPGNGNWQWAIVAQCNMSLCRTHADYIQSNAMLHASPREQLLGPGDGMNISFLLTAVDSLAQLEALYQQAQAAGCPAALGVEAGCPFELIEYGQPAPEWLRHGDKYSNCPAVTSVNLPDLRYLTPEQRKEYWFNTLFFTHAVGDKAVRQALREAGMPCTLYYNWMEIYPKESDDYPAGYHLLEHPEWINIDEKGEKRISGWGQAHNLELYSTCMHQLSLHERAAAQMRELFTGDGQVNGIFIDNCSNLPECFGDKFGVHSHQPGKDNHAMYMELLKAVYAAVKACGKDNIVMQNNNNNPAHWSFCDTSMAEETVIFTDWETLEYKGRLAAEAYRHGKVPSILNYLQFSYNRDTREYYSTDEFEAIEYNCTFSYVYARLFDMLWSAWNYLYEQEHLMPLAQRYFRLDLSNPTSPLQQTGKVFHRDFGRYKLLLNSDRRHPAALTVDGKWRNINDDQVYAGEIELEPYGAIILEKVD